MYSYPNKTMLGKAWSEGIKSVWKHRRPSIAKTILRRKNKAVAILLPISNYTIKP